MSQTKRNLTIKFLDLNFASRRKLCKNSVFYENMKIFAFVLFWKVFIFSRFCSCPFRKCIAVPNLSDIDILRDSVPDLKFSTRSVTVNTFKWLWRIFFWSEEVDGGLASGWFVTVANFDPLLLFFLVGRGNSCGKTLDRKFSNAVFAECDRSSPIKKLTERLNLRELQVDDISAKFNAESTKKYIPVR